MMGFVCTAGTLSVLIFIFINVGITVGLKGDCSGVFQVQTAGILVWPFTLMGGLYAI